VLIWIVLAGTAGLGAGAALGAFLAARRVRRLYARSEQLEKQVAESERMAYVGRLTSGLAHELKNPLSTLNLNLQLLAEDLRLPQTEVERRTARKLAILQSETRRLEEILEAFLRFAGRMELRRKRLDVGELVGDLLAFYEPQAVQHGITLREQVDANLPPVDGDADLLKQALLNIILNAQAVMTDGGELMVAVRAADGGVAISVTDTGPGIPPDRQERIFDAYYSSRPGGMGLGLPTVKRIMTEHRGKVSVNSEVGRGTQFVLWLPAAAEDTEQTHE